MAEDVDRDGYDELIITTGDGNSDSKSYLYVYDKLTSGWNQTYRSDKLTETAVPSSDVGNVIAAATADFPEIVTAGYQTGRSDKFKCYVTKINGWKKETDNWQANYKTEVCGANGGTSYSTNAFIDGGRYPGQDMLSPLAVA